MTNTKSILIGIIVLCGVHATLLSQIDTYRYSKGLTSEDFGIGYSKALENPDTVKRLSFNGDGLNDLPFELLKFKNLRQLQVSNNNLREIPDWLLYLDKLEIVWIAGNENLDLQQAMGILSHLPNLKVVWLGDELYPNVENTLSLLKNVKIITITHNRHWSLKSIIEEVSCLNQLESLELPSRPIEFLPPNFHKLGFLKEVSFEFCKISDELKKRMQILLPSTKLYF